MRLIARSGPPSSLEGRVEIYLEEEWGTVSYNATGYSQKGTAQAICRQLGFPDQAEYGLATSLKYVGTSGYSCGGNIAVTGPIIKERGLTGSFPPAEVFEQQKLSHDHNMIELTNQSVLPVLGLQDHR